jgi:hypothetical protein
MARRSQPRRHLRDAGVPPGIRENRRAPRIRAAFAQLWGTDDLWVTIDRGGFNPPDLPGRSFAVPPLHWDISLVPPFPDYFQGSSP